MTERNSGLNFIFPERDIPSWECYEKELETEFLQCMDEGLDIESYKGLFEEAAKMPEGIFKTRIGDVLFDIVNNASPVDGYKYNEPSSLDEIRQLRKSYDIAAGKPADDELASRIKGAWLGRICGCLLGKPVEGIRTNELIPLLKETGNYPMSRYILSSELTDEMYEKTEFQLRDKCWADTITSAPADDDTNYTVLGTMLIEKYGRDFTPENVLELWHANQLRDAYCTAERVAWRNYLNGYLPPYSAIYKNPYREWIGAQIRGDYFGYINPGDPEKAAEYAWRDASISHTKNGIYGEMFIAAMLACAAVTDNVRDAIEGGLAQIPATSRLYECVKSVIGWYDDGVDEEECRRRIHSMYDEKTGHGWCHTIPNAMIVVMALMYHDNYGEAICSAVQTCFDTDCNGATVGSVFGMLHGDRSIAPAWTAPIRNTLSTSIIGNKDYNIDELTDITLKHING